MRLLFVVVAFLFSAAVHAGDVTLNQGSLNEIKGLVSIDQFTDPNDHQIRGTSMNVKNIDTVVNGRTRVNWRTPFKNADYLVFVTCAGGRIGNVQGDPAAYNECSVIVECRENGTPSGSGIVNVQALGKIDQTQTCP